MKRVLVFGSTGMLGHMVLRVLSRVESVLVDGTYRSSPSGVFYFDAEAGVRGLRRIVEYRGGYDYFINCIGIVKAHIDEQDSDSVRRAIVINGLFPHELAAFASEIGTRVIHVSTDGVFSGASEEPYLEDAPHDCLDVYGKTKSLGEVRTVGFLSIRCSIIGPDPLEKKGLLEWFLAQPPGQELVGYTDHLWNGITTLQFAELCKRLIVQDCSTEIWAESPVHHFCPNRALSKYELLRLFGEVFGRRVVVSPGPAPGGPLRHLLVSRYRGLREMFGAELEMADALRALTLERTTR